MPGDEDDVPSVSELAPALMLPFTIFSVPGIVREKGKIIELAVPMLIVRLAGPLVAGYTIGSALKFAAAS